MADREVLRIRAHHLLCMQGFQGYGYSQNFVDNMTEIINNIKSTPGLLVEIISECDSVCLCCPHNVGGVCSKEPDSREKIKKMDMEVLRRLDINEGAKIFAKDIFGLVNTKLKRISDAIEICGDCSWRAQCTWYASRDAG